MLNKLSRIGFWICVGIVVVLLMFALFLPKTYEKIVPYRFYNVLTNSMEPKIGTNSLVLVRLCNERLEIEENDIITFMANRFGEKIIVTHRFSHTETNEKGEMIYRTHPEKSEILDVYETKKEDIVGVYVFHIPYVGKIILFLKSRFGLLWVCEMILIYLVNQWILARWEEKEKSGCFCRS